MRAFARALARVIVVSLTRHVTCGRCEPRTHILHMYISKISIARARKYRRGVVAGGREWKWTPVPFARSDAICAARVLARTPLDNVGPTTDARVSARNRQLSAQFSTDAIAADVFSADRGYDEAELDRARQIDKNDNDRICDMRKRNRVRIIDDTP